MPDSTPAMFKLELRKLPAAPLGERILLKPFPPIEETEGGITFPDIAKDRPYAGILLAVGDQAADKAFDQDIRVGDVVWWAKFAGVLEEWHHIVEDGDRPCTHPEGWKFHSRPGFRKEMRECETCGAKKLAEEVIVANIEDILCDVTLQLRYENGETRRIRGEDDNGRTRYYIERAPFNDTLEVNGPDALKEAA